MLLTYSKDIFVDLIKHGLKIHTLREDPKMRWKPGRSIQHWRGNPRNTKSNPYHFLNGECKQVEGINIRRKDSRLYGLEITVYRADIPNVSYRLSDEEIQMLATNDGLGVATFREWFVPDKHSFWNGRIIHFTDFKYCK